MLEAEDPLDVDAETLRAKERLRVVKTAERQTRLAEAALKLQERSVLAQQRQAAAMEALVATVQSVVGIGRQRCYNSSNLGGVDNDKPALFIRTGTGSKTFACAVKRAYVIADNRLTDASDWDDDMLRLELNDLLAGGFELAHQLPPAGVHPNG
ncbi:hypothetical protein [Bradyrhizobium sp. CCGUVB23]|uniref:hypothetical protein n=1 Tax=Bradyrhizobium sp. CCGUVB23 TaxID=2949630 RepID=UPI0020B26B28|nr:hypothetical protein [Bradyrhizobium sp. CCGUVB23]MCP3460349.1 hypothetical protein [Bradyrhizobium sp. CCGUVB23]